MPRKKKKKSCEYLLRVFHRHDETGRKKSVAFVVETTREFVSFNYQIKLEDQRSDNMISLKILGIHAPVTSMPGVGQARGVRQYEGILGKVNVVVRNTDEESNEFEILVDPRHVTLIRSPQQPFIMFSSEEVPLIE